MGNLISDISPRKILSSYIENVSLPKAISLLNSEGYEIASAEQKVQLLLQEGFDSPIASERSVISDRILFVMNKGKFWIKKMPNSFLDNKENYTKNGMCYHSDNQLYQILDNSESLYEQKNINALDKILENSFPLHEIHNIIVYPQNFKEGDIEDVESREVISYVFGDFAKDYADFWQSKTKNSLMRITIPITSFLRKACIKRRVNAISTPIIFSGNNQDFGLFGHLSLSCYNCERIRGVKDALDYSNN